jgi:GNAT superfamily N-acetyltransferase
MYTHKSSSLLLTIWDEKHAALADFYSQKKGKGHGSKLLAEVVHICDATNLSVILQAESGNPKMKTKNLVKFYKKHGFEVLGNSKKSPVLMRREPTKKKKSKFDKVKIVPL